MFDLCDFNLHNFSGMYPCPKMRPACNTASLNHVLKFKYQPACLKVEYVHDIAINRYTKLLTFLSSSVSYSHDVFFRL